MKKIILIFIIFLAFFLRLYKISSIPPSLYWDEVSLGYNAYSILETGWDEFGNFLPLTNFPAFGDYKPPGYIYLTVPSIYLFGLNEFAVRFPSAILGTMTVLLAFFLTRKIFKNDKVALLCAFFLAVSPWHIQLSRAAFEANAALLFSTLGIFFFIKFARDSKYFLFLSALSFLAAVYTFTGQRLFVPFILFILAAQFWKELVKNYKTVFFTGLFSLIIFLPLFKFATGTIEGRLRFEEVTIFKDLDPIKESTDYRRMDNFSWWSGVVHNRRLFYTHDYLTHYFDAFSPNFLLTSGDINPRFSTQETGQLYYVEAFFVLIGLFFLVKNRFKYTFLILGWLLISPLGPATARETPHALRMIHILPTFQIIAAYGLYYSLVKFKRNNLFKFGLLILVFISVYYFLHNYFSHWSKEYSGQWQYGYKQAIESIRGDLDSYDKVLVTKSQGRPYVYFLFYLKYPPSQFQSNADVQRDEFYFIDVKSFDKFIFSENPAEELVSGNLLFITRPGHLPPDAVKINSIYDLSGKSVFEIGEISEN